MSPSSASSSSANLASRPATSSHHKAQSSGSGYASTISSFSSKDSDPGYKAQLSHALHLKGQNSRFRSASSSVYEDSLNGREDERKENIRPRAETTSNNQRKAEPAHNRLLGASIPLLRRARSNLGKTTPPSTGTQATSKWDHKGEAEHVASSRKSTQSGSSKYTRPFAYPDKPGFGVEVSISGGSERAKKPTFAERAAKFGRDTLPEVRPPWKGGNKVEAAKNKSHNMQQDMYTIAKHPESVYRKGYAGHAGSEESLEEADRRRGGLSEGAHSQLKDKSQLLQNARMAHAPQISSQTPRAISRKPVATASKGSGSEMEQTLAPTIGLDSSAIRPFSREFAGDLSSDSDDSTITLSERKKQEPKSHFSWSTYAGSVHQDGDGSGNEDEGQDDHKVNYDYESRTPDAKRFGGQDLASRFSWTTVNTDATHAQPSPPSSPSTPPAGPPSPIMMRRRPVQREGSISGLAGTSSTNSQMATTDNTGRPGSSASSNNKALPLPPTLEKESTYIEALQARSDDLDIRVVNTQRVISEMQKLERASPLEVTEKMRRENRKKLSEMNEKLGEIQRERHEAGMALARARSRAQKEEGEDSALWLRRVAG